MAINMVVGPPGSGKSFVLTSIALKRLKKDSRPVFANFSIRGAERFTLDEMADLPPCTLLVDEAQNLFHARMWRSMPADMLERWSQTRKAGWDIFLGTQHESNVDSVVRRVVQYGWLLEPRWAPLSVIDPRVRRNARVAGREAAAKLEERARPIIDAGPWGYAGGPEAYAGFVRAHEQRVRRLVERGEPVWHHRHPLYVYGRRWLWHNFRSMRKGERPIQRYKWYWSWAVADAYDTFEVTRLRGREGTRMPGQLERPTSPVVPTARRRAPRTGAVPQPAPVVDAALWDTPEAVLVDDFLDAFADHDDELLGGSHVG